MQAIDTANWKDILFLILLGFLFVQLCYRYFFHLRLSLFKGAKHQGKAAPVSVIICARNEEENLLEFLPLLLSQDYPEYEVIVVDDCSLDDSENVLRAFLKAHVNFKMVTIRETKTFSGGKKFAITLGIKAAKYEHLVFIDADCYPASNSWLKEMALAFNENKHIVLGAGLYKKEKGFLNALIRLDAFFIAQQYLSFALAGMPYMGVGRNLAYKKDLFFKNKGFASHNHLVSGDDDLFINEVATNKNTSVVYNANALTISIPEKTFALWHRQKMRHATTASRYKFKHLFLLGLYQLSYKLTYTLFIVLAVLMHRQIELISLLTFWWLSTWAISYKPMKVASLKTLWIFAPIMEIVIFVLQGFFFISSLFSKTKIKF